MTDLFLIAHKVRNEPAFDIAIRMACSECNAIGCPECDDLGYWWIISTSGARAYPWWHFPLGALMHDNSDLALIRTVEAAGPMPDGLPDHYPCNDRTTPRQSLADRLGLRVRPGATIGPFPRRI